MPSPPSSKSVLFAVAALVIAVAGTLGLTEIAARIYEARTRPEKGAASDFEARKDLCGEKGCATYNRHWAKLVHDTARADTPSMFRIAWLGDSMGQCGSCVQNKAGQPYPIHVERLLNARLGGRYGIDFAVDNYSTGAAQLEHHAALLRDLEGPSRYPLVVYGAFHNDLVPVAVVKLADDDYRFVGVDPDVANERGMIVWPQPWRDLEPLLGGSALFRVFRYRALLARASTYRIDAATRPLHASMAARLDYLDDMQTVAARRGQGLWVLLVPAVNCVQDAPVPNPAEAGQCASDKTSADAIVARTRQLGLPFIDGAPALRGLDPEKILEADRYHNNVWGHQVLAEYVVTLMIPKLCRLPPLAERLKNAPECAAELTPAALEAARVAAQQNGLAHPPEPWR